MGGERFILTASRGYWPGVGACWIGLMAPGIAPDKNNFSNAAIRCCMALFSSAKRALRFSKWRIYSVALLSTYRVELVMCLYVL